MSSLRSNIFTSKLKFKPSVSDSRTFSGVYTISNSFYFAAIPSFFIIPTVIAAAVYTVKKFALYLKSMVVVSKK